MKKRSIRIGELLVELGRATHEEVERALAHQREHGGFVGDALVGLGVVTREEIRWCLADQHDLPFVHLRPESIDLALAACVPAAWAREHLALPVLRSGETVTVVLEDPAAVEELEEVRRLTGASEVEPALASPEAIRELIESVYGRGRGPVVPLARVVSEAIERGARSLGVSARPGRAVAWHSAEETVFRTLGAEWPAELEALVSPISPLPASPVYGPRSWPAMLRLAGKAWRVECHALGRGESLEWAAHIVGRAGDDPSAVRMHPAAATAVRLALVAGGARVTVDAGNDVAPEFLESAIPALPSLLAGEDVRSLHLSDLPVASPPGTLYLLLREPLSLVLPRVEPFALEALTLSVDALTETEVEDARRVA
ncbi:MAG: hypothetical protein M3483_04590, partial [Gemmatimonadota bacterium]|nr:hypothetical protein [Gemmatimonadota bacterium]